MAETCCGDEEGYRWTDRGRRPNPMTSHDTLLLREIEQDRADQLARRLTLKHMEAIAKDTRLPGEIACTYGITAEVVIRIKQNARRLARPV